MNTSVKLLIVNHDLVGEEAFFRLYNTDLTLSHFKHRFPLKSISSGVLMY